MLGRWIIARLYFALMLRLAPEAVTGFSFQWKFGVRAQVSHTIVECV